MSSLASGLIPSPWPVCHIARWIDESSTDEHGNNPITEDPPVIRWIYSVVQFGRRGSSAEVMGPEFEERIETVLHMACNDPTVYKASDQVILHPQLDTDGNYVPDTGTAYWVDGDISDERLGPWPSLLQWSGGIVKIRRVT
jgi:hypothetical protein